MKTLVLNFIALLLAHPPANAAELTAQRAVVLSRADVWSRPSWMGADLSFSPSFDIKKVHREEKTLDLFENDTVYCQMTESYATQDRGFGKSPKFHCDLMKVGSNGQHEVVKTDQGKTVKLKVKYSINTFGMAGVKADSNAEIQAEVTAARLFTSLGFAADKMFAVQTLKCYGCSSDPWNIREIDKSSLNNPRSFSRVSIEFKAAGDEILNEGVRGWSYPEIMNARSFSKNPTVAREQLLERQALFILAGMLQHSDNKADNHRLVCEGSLDERGECRGTVRLMIHDLGFTFGGGTKAAHLPGCFPYCSSKAELKMWANEAVWWDERRRNACTVNMGLSAAMKHPVVTDEARVFLARLLRKFVDGEAGQKRLIELFSIANLEAAGRGKATDWAKTFIEKVEEIENPALSDNNRQLGDRYAQYRKHTRKSRAQDSAITCPNRIDNVLEKVFRKQR